MGKLLRTKITILVQVLDMNEKTVIIAGLSIRIGTYSVDTSFSHQSLQNRRNVKTTTLALRSSTRMLEYKVVPWIPLLRNLSWFNDSLSANTLVSYIVLSTTAFCDMNSPGHVASSNTRPRICTPSRVHALSLSDRPRAASFLKKLQNMRSLCVPHQVLWKNGERASESQLAMGG